MPAELKFKFGRSDTSCLQKVKGDPIDMNASKEKIVLIGGGGHSKVVVDAILRMGEFAIFGIIDSNIPRGSRILGIEVLGPDKMLPDIFEKGTRYAFISMASMGNCDTRKRIYANLKKIGFNIPAVIHPKRP